MTNTHSQVTAFDPSFGVNGKLEVRPPGNFSNDLSSVTNDPGGRLIIVGAYERETPASQRPGVARLMDDGVFDNGFGDTQDGLTTAPINTLATSASSIAVLADGSLFITGAANNELPLINYDRDGKFISNWGEVAEGPQYAIPRLLALEDKFLVATVNNNGGIIYRRHADGAVDGSFGDEGQTTFLAGNRYIATSHMARSAITSSFYLSGEAGNDGFILRMTASGELDHAFADGGVYSIKMIGARFNGCRKMIELSDGKILALINSSDFDSGAAGYLIRLTATGHIDATFNRGEPLRIAGDVGEDFTLQADGRMLVAHRSPTAGNQLTRYLPDGNLDTEFGDNASATITFDDEQFSFVKSVAVQPDGKIVVGGTFGSITVLLRLLA